MIFRPRRWIEPHLMDVLDDLRFELSSLKGRLLTPRNISTRNRSYLQLGCGEDVLSGFLNTDFFSNPRADAHVDARFPLPFAAGSFKGVYAHHIIEHLSYSDAHALFREVVRVLQAGGVFRMVVPDLEVFIREYASTNPAEFRGIAQLLPPTHLESTMHRATALELIDHKFRDTKFNRHLSSWDWQTAQLRLSESGFSRIVLQQVGESLDPMLAGHDKPHWAPHSLYVEAVR